MFSIYGIEWQQLAVKMHLWESYGSWAFQQRAPAAAAPHLSQPRHSLTPTLEVHPSAASIQLITKLILNPRANTAGTSHTTARGRAAEKRTAAACFI